MCIFQFFPPAAGYQWSGADGFLGFVGDFKVSYRPAARSGCPKTLRKWTFQLEPFPTHGKVEHREVLLSTGLYFAHFVSTVSQISWNWKIWRQVSLFHTKTCFLCFLWFFYKLSPDTRASNTFSTFVFLRFCFDLCIQTEEILLLFLLLITYL